MNYEKWDEILAPYQHAVEELKVKFKNIRKEFLTKGEYSPIEFVTEIGRASCRERVSSPV